MDLTSDRLPNTSFVAVTIISRPTRHMNLRQFTAVLAECLGTHSLVKNQCNALLGVANMMRIQANAQTSPSAK